MTGRKLNKILVLQQDEKDCGVSCLKTIFRYYGSDVSLEKLRRESGTSSKGTSMLGLYQSALIHNFNSEGLQGNTEELKAIQHPVILHVNLEGNLEHYIVFFRYENNKFIIGDPAEGIVRYTDKELSNIWLSGYLLDLSPNSEFKASGLHSDQSLKWLKKHLIPDKNLFISSLFLGTIIALLGLATAVFTEQLVDEILPERDFSLLLKGVCSWGILLLLANLFTYFRQLLMFRQSFEFNQRVIQYFLGKLIHLPKSFFDSKKQGDMIARMNDSEKIQSAIQYVLGQATIDTLLLIISFSFLFYYNLQTALFAAAILPLLIILISIYLRSIKFKQKEVMVNYAINESNYIETTNGINTIKSFQKEEYFRTKAQTIYKKYQVSIFSFRRFTSGFDLSIDSINSICLILTIAYSSFLYFEDKIELGELIASLTIVNILIGSAENLVLANINIQGAKVALERMFEFTEEEHEDSKSSHQEALEFRELHISNLNFAYSGQGQLLNDISFTVGKGEIISILGENGCGKSSLMQIIQKFYSNYSGEIKVNGKDLQHLSTNQWRNALGIVPQNIKIFNGNILDNICLQDGEEEEDKIVSFCKEIGVDQYFSNLHHSYYTLVGEEGINLSGGEKQLLALTRALYRNPQILILDEVTSAMDRNTENFVLDLLKNLNGNTTILFITHRLHILKSFNSKILVMENGKIKANGYHEELLKEDNLYSNYWKDLLYA
jgi:ATP-binding cassette subfamily B protein